MTLVLPANAESPVPVMMMFGGRTIPEIAFPAPAFPGRGGPGGRGPAAPPPNADRPAREQRIADGWGVATIAPNSIQADNGAGLTKGIIGLVNHAQPRKPDDWGALRAWAWGASRGDRATARSGFDAGRGGGRGRAPGYLRRWAAAALARGAPRSRRDGVGGGGPVERRRRARRAGCAAGGPARRHTARPRRGARPLEGPLHRAVRRARRDRQRAGVRAERAARPRHPRALRPLRARAHPLDLRAARRLPRGVAGVALAQAPSRARAAVRGDVAAAVRLPLAARSSPPRAARRGGGRGPGRRGGRGG